MFSKLFIDKNSIFRKAFYILIATVFLCFFLSELLLPVEREESKAYGDIFLNTEWVWLQGEERPKQITVPGTYEVDPGYSMVIETILPANCEGKSLCIRAAQQSVKFFVDGSLRTDYNTEHSRLFGKKTASSYVFCKLSAEDDGKVLQIALTSDSQAYSGVVNEVYFADKLVIWENIYEEYFLETLAGFFLLLLGIVTVVISLFIAAGLRKRLDIEYLGWLFILGSVWIISESRFRQFLFPNSSAVSNLSFVMVVLSPYVMSLYVNSLQKQRYSVLYNVLSCATIINLVLSTAFQLFGVCDYLDVFPISLVVLGATMLVIIITLYLDAKKGFIKEYRLVVIGIVTVTLACIAECFVTLIAGNNSGLFLTIGLLVLLLFGGIKAGDDVNKLQEERHIAKVEEKYRSTEKMSLQMVQSLANAVDSKDVYTKGHSIRVASLSAIIASDMGWDLADVENIRYAATLHDIGMVGVPDAIVNKPGKLSDSEFSIVKTHTALGSDILKNVALIHNAETIAKYHHERYDGKGYPEGLSGEDIPIHARIVSLADAYDAMASERSYRGALCEQKIREEIMNGKGTQFDPELTDIFLKAFDEGRLLVSDEPAEEKGSSSDEAAGEIIKNVVATMNATKTDEGMDYLTGLPMRSLGEQKIAECMREHSGCLVFLDMDNLKKINDLYGHKAGDRSLTLLGDIITEKCPNCVACRLGGDEFLIYIKDVSKFEASRIVDEVFRKFMEEKNKDITIKPTSISAGLCMCGPSDYFDDVYTKADKALYFVKQNGKDDYSFYQNMTEGENYKASGVDLKQLVKSIRSSGEYEGAMDLEYREFAKLYEYLSNINERYKHSCHLVMVSIEADSEETMFIDEIERAMGCMEKAIRENIRNVDICTRYSSLQYLVILLEVGEDNLSMVMDRIFAGYYSLYGKNLLKPEYEATKMLKE